MRRQAVETVRELLRHALQLREEQKAWAQYLTLYPHMLVPSPDTQKHEPILTYRPFDQFWRAQAAPENAKPALTAEEIVSKFEAVKQRHQASKKAS